MKVWGWATGWVLLSAIIVTTGHVFLALVPMAIAFGYMVRAGQPKPSTANTAGSRSKLARGGLTTGTSLDGDVVVLTLDDDDEE